MTELAGVSQVRYVSALATTTLIAPASAAVQAATTRSSTLLSRYVSSAELAVTSFFAVFGGFCTTDFLQLVVNCHRHVVVMQMATHTEEVAKEEEVLSVA